MIKHKADVRPGHYIVYNCAHAGIQIEQVIKVNHTLDGIVFRVEDRNKVYTNITDLFQTDTYTDEVFESWEELVNTYPEILV